MEEQRTMQAPAVAMILSALVGKAVTPAQVLGTEKEEKAERQKEAEAAAKKLLRKMKKAGLA